MSETQKIEMNKQYRTRDGRKVRVLCVDCQTDQYPVVALVLYRECEEESLSFTETGCYNAELQYSDLDLIEYNPAQDLKVDDKIWVQSTGAVNWLPRHFSRYSDGKIYCWSDGNTSHTTAIDKLWEHWKKD